VKGSVRRPLVLTVGAACALLGVARCGGHPNAPTPTLAIFCPGNVNVQPPTGTSTAQVTFADPTTAGGKPPMTTTCSAKSGDTFPPGDHQINCSVVDSQSHSASCTFDVDVAAPIPQLSVTKFLGFGDSETEGKVGQSPSQLFPTSYTIKLQSMLQARYSAQTVVVANDGQGGQEAADPQTLRRFEDALARENPQVVLLMDGANDLDKKGDDGVDPVVNALDTMVGRASARGISVFLATIPPEKPCSAGSGSVSSLNNKIAALAGRRQLTLVDVYAAFNGDLGLIGSDCLHPTDAGYQVIAQAFYDKIVAKLETAPSASSR
jgi:lysophospholipase L1-like esterase